MTLGTPVVVNVSLMGPEWDHDTRVTFLGTTFRIVRRGTAGDVDTACDLVREWAPRASALAVTGVREAQAVRPVRRRAPGPPTHHDGGRLDPGHRRGRPPRGPPGVGGTPRRDRDAGLLHQRPDRGARGTTPRPDDPDPARAHREHPVRRPVAPPRPARPAVRPAARPPARRPGRGPRGRRRRRRDHPVPAAGPRRGAVPAHRPRPPGRTRPGPAGGPRLRRPRRDVRRAERLRARGPRREDPHHHLDLAGATGRPRRPRRRPGRRRDAAALRRRHRQRGHAGGADDRVRARGQHAHPRRPAGHDRRRRPGAAAAPTQRTEAPEPVRVRHPPAVAGVPAQRRAPAHRLAHRAPARHGPGREGRGLQPAVHLQPRHRHHLTDRRGGRGLAHQRRRAPRTR